MPTIPSDGSNSPTGTTHSAGTTVTYKCDEGYTLVGPESNTCLLNDTWTENTAPVCMQNCPDPPTSSDLLVSPNSPYVLDDVVMYSCVNQAAVPSVMYNLCQSPAGSLEWAVQDAPTCSDADSCGPPPMIASDGINPENRDYADGSVVRYQCNPRRRLLGSDFNGCTDGTWTDAAPRCIQECKDFQDCTIIVDYDYCSNTQYTLISEEYCRKSCNVCTTCGAPPAGDGVSVAPAGPYVQGQQVNYTCASGDLSYTVNLCLDDGTWLFEQEPTCSETDCNNLPTNPDLINTPSGSAHNNGVVVTYSCPEGFLQLPPYNNTCSGGAWSEGEAGQCLKLCSDPSPVGSFLTVSSVDFPIELEPYKDLITNTVVGITYNFNCTGGRLEGAASITCLSNGSYSAEQPVCVPDCTDLPTNPNLINTPSGTGHNNDTVVIYTCPDDFVQVPPFNNTCEGGAWTEPDAGKCLKICPVPELGAFLAVFADLPIELMVYANYITELVSGVTVHFGCTGGRLQGASSATCLENGTFSAEVPVCVPDCPNMPTDPNGFNTPDGTAHNNGTVVNYNCTEEYTLVPPLSNACVGGNWNESEAGKCLRRCDDIFIGEVDQLLNGFFVIPEDVMEYAQFLAGAVAGVGINFNCSNGNLLGASSTVCQQNGTWSENLPECLADCGPPQLGNDLELVTTPAAFTEGVMVQYQCKNGADIGNVISTCQADASWSLTVLPSCGP
uniref:Sushi, von Willebrand factor type A, EGF and pentraxin domain-containing protein 1 n=1 Tax=Phallusia mammillata TaxID=59560 RepID=A0A6F9DUQ2_9ASCI|nr:sushi, von Willebrand factor type A, EGF and pentraxin domain-containing protein 1 [Phallusia mammillata]